jgi:hypothetical protein
MEDFLFRKGKAMVMRLGNRVPEEALEGEI